MKFRNRRRPSAPISSTFPCALLPLGVRQVRGAAGERKRWPAFYWHAAGVIGRYEKTVIDCPDPALAKFTSGGECESTRTSTAGRHRQSPVSVSWRPRATEWVPPRQPRSSASPATALDIRVDDADQAEQGSGRLAPLSVRCSVKQGSGSLIDPRRAPILHRSVAGAGWTVAAHAAAGVPTGRRLPRKSLRGRTIVPFFLAVMLMR